MSKKKYIFSLLLLIMVLMLFACNAQGEPQPTEKPTEAPVHVHTFDDWQTVSEATCSTEGLMTRECTECGEKEQHNVQKLPHTLTASVIAPTCDEQGYTAYVCECGYSHSSNYTEPLGHKFTESVTAPTCTEQGHTHYECNVCDYEFDGDFVKPLGHSFESVTVRPTATRGGYTTYTCHCSYSYVSDRVFYSDILNAAGTEVLHKGIDVSKWNHTLQNGEYLPLDWDAIKAAGIDFVILKVGGLNGIEPTFEMDYASAKAAGLEVGAYFYTYSTTVEGVLNDADNVLEWIAGKQFEYPIYLDLEDASQEALGKDILSEMCLAFIEALQENGYYAALYTNYNWLTYILDTEKITSLFDIWYARYPGTNEPIWDEEKYGKPLGMWQYTDTGTIEGMSCYFDLNYAYKNYSELMKRWGLNGF